MGWIAAFVLLMTVVLVHEAGHAIAAWAVGAPVKVFSIGFGRKLFGFERGGTEYRWSLWPLGGYIEPNEEIFQKLSVWRRMIVILAGVKANFTLAVVLMWGIFFTGYPTLAPIVGAVMDGSPAEQAGLEEGDEVRVLDGQAVRGWDEIGRILQRSGGKSVAIIVKRDGADVRSFITPEKQEVPNMIGLPEERFMLGVAPSEESVMVALPFFEALERATVFNYEMLKLNAQGIAAIFQGKLAAKDNLSGPVGIVSISNQAYKFGWTNYIMLAALISAVIGMMNLLPLPVLDGGQFVLLALEGIGLRVGEFWIGALNRVGIYLLLALMLYATWFDIARLFG